MRAFAVKNGRLTVILATLFAINFFYCGQARSASPLPTFALPNAADGTMVHSNSFSGKVLLIDFFTTW